MHRKSKDKKNAPEKVQAHMAEIMAKWLKLWRNFLAYSSDSG
jgi:hypothetical protein